jgi:RecB family exonuclease
MTRTFTSRVGEEGEWPGLPEHWSFSTLTEVESCPLRYSLRRAAYAAGGLGGSGYPDKTSEAALIGTVTHAAVERVVRVLRGVADVSNPQAVIEALRAVGGYSAIIDQCISSTEAQLALNPRMSERSARLGASLRRRAPEIRGVVQRLVSRMSPLRFSDHPEPRVSESRAAQRRRLPLGPIPEAKLQADGQRFKGQVDLLTVKPDAADIVDFKTGSADEYHAEQVTLYGLLWILDEQANPDRSPVGTMTVAYAGSETDVPHPSDWGEVESTLLSRISAADDSISGTPTARLSDACSWCPVRHMCEAYWNSDHSGTGDWTFGDAEVEMLSRNGALSWNVRLVGAEGEALLRTTSEEVSFDSGATIRVLDVMRERQVADDGVSEVIVLTTLASSETFEVLDR